MDPDNNWRRARVARWQAQNDEVDRFERWLNRFAVVYAIVVVIVTVVAIWGAITLINWLVTK